MPFRSSRFPYAGAELWPLRLERLLLENVVPFWYPALLDRNGGYHLNHDARGRFRGPGAKRLVTQARVTWFFSRLAASPYGSAGHLRFAQHGFAFLWDRMWDAEHGGFFWDVDASAQPIEGRDAKHLYAQAFGLYALCEYAAVSGEREAIDRAKAAFSSIERAHDDPNGGYVECMRRDWSASDPGTGMLAAGPPFKLFNTHLHLLEAFTRYYEVTRDAAVRDRLAELVAILSNAVVRKRFGACTDVHGENWAPLLDKARARVSYGHDLENAALLLNAYDALGWARAPLLDLCRTLTETALSLGYDTRRGGFYESGPLGKRADVRRKTWWVQAEALLTLLRMYEITGDGAYLPAFDKTLQWIERRQADRRNGEWFAYVEPNGRVSGDKAGPWKGPYHNGRALLSCLEMLSGLGD